MQKDVLPNFQSPCHGSILLPTDKTRESTEYTALYRLPSKGRTGLNLIEYYPLLNIRNDNAFSFLAGDYALASELLNSTLFVLLKSKISQEDLGILELDLLPLASGSSSVSQDVYCKQLGQGKALGEKGSSGLQGPWVLRVSKTLLLSPPN